MNIGKYSHITQALQDLHWLPVRAGIHFKILILVVKAIHGALSIQQKFRFEISEIPRAQWNGTFRLHRPDPIHRAFDSSCKKDTKQRYWGQQFCQMERDISVRPTEMTRPVKVGHFQSWFRINSGRTKPKWFVPFDAPTEISGILG